MTLQQKLDEVCDLSLKMLKTMKAKQTKKSGLLLRRHYESTIWQLRDELTREIVATPTFPTHNLTRGEMLLYFESLGYQNIRSD